jgi:membrane protease YdiL (CAAX protease family)
MTVTTSRELEAARGGKIVVERWFYNYMHTMQQYYTANPHLDTKTAKEAADDLENSYLQEARHIANNDGGDVASIEKKLHDSFAAHGPRDFVAPRLYSAFDAAKRLPVGPSFPTMFGSMALVWWGLMLVCQGEGLELDLQRRRHPMWEWLFSHPVPPGAVFLAEMLSPIAANPIYIGAPLFVGIVYGICLGLGAGIAAAIVIGIPVTIAAACLGKALEIGITLRFAPRSRGAMIGLITWWGYASLMMCLLGIAVVPKLIPAIGGYLEPLLVLPWPWLGFFLGQRADGSFSFGYGMLACWLVTGVTIAAAVRFSIWGAQKGLTGDFGAAASMPSAAGKEVHFGKDPLYKKEILWFIRDRSAIVQTILIPITVASAQLFNMRNLLSMAGNGWNYLCGVGILFGTYFLWILGPKSLSSEGTALWISLTWPRGLESLLKAKGWLWSLISSGIVALVLLFACIRFPESTWKIALVGIGWFFFSRSMAEKTVTLVTVTSSSGEPEKIPASRRWAASLGMLTFAIGICTQRWQIAIMGIVYSYLTAAAMWQNFRARLPYLYDPWSEKLPPPPTLMHAMIAISILVEGGAVLTGLAMIPFGAKNIAVVQSVVYCVCAVVVSIVMAGFLANRDVSARSVWFWEDGADDAPRKSWLADIGFSSLLIGALGGVALGLFAHGYLAIIYHFPFAADAINKSQEQMAIPGMRLAYTIAAVGFAPFAEEYLFRGLLYRALDREWGGWHAVLGAAAFFAIYHQPLSWVPVGLLGATNAMLFKKTGKLAPAVVLHMVYNAVVLS